ncbi:MAG: DUF3267 domain-containing protein [Aggregatilineales bacterium]
MTLTEPAIYVQHYYQEDVSIPLEKIVPRVMLFALLLLIIPLLIYALLWGQLPLNYSFEILPVFVIMIVLHELIHAIGWKVAGGLRWQDLKFGFSWRGLSPYCHAKAPMTAQAYRVGTILPGIITGLIPALTGIITHDSFLTFLGAILIAGAVGDLYVLWIIRKVSSDVLLLDHPSQAGCIVLHEKLMPSD